LRAGPTPKKKNSPTLLPKTEKKINDECKNIDNWLSTQLAKQEQIPFVDDPIVTTDILRQRREALEKFCNPIINKPKPEPPKPKEEPKKEEPKKEEPKKEESKKEEPKKEEPKKEEPKKEDSKSAPNAGATTGGQTKAGDSKEKDKMDTQ